MAEEEASQALQTQVDEESIRRSKLTALIEQYNTTTTVAPTTTIVTNNNTSSNSNNNDIEEGKSGSSSRGNRLNKTATVPKTTVSGSGTDKQDKKWNQTTR